MPPSKNPENSISEEVTVKIPRVVAHFLRSRKPAHVSMSQCLLVYVVAKMREDIESVGKLSESLECGSNGHVPVWIGEKARGLLRETKLSPHKAHGPDALYSACQDGPFAGQSNFAYCAIEQPGTFGNGATRARRITGISQSCRNPKSIIHYI